MSKPVVTFKIRGQEAIVEKIRVLSPKVVLACSVAAMRQGYKVANDAKYMCPVKTGRLRASLTVNWTKGPARAPLKKGSTDPKNMSTPDDTVGPPTDKKGFYVAVGTNVEYAEDVEERSPYLWPAFKMHEAEYLNELQGILKNTLRVVGSVG